MLRLHDTASGSLEVVTAEGASALGLYVCGPTVYGPAHIGHGRFTLVYDVLRKYLESTGVEVRHVSNVTDIDDKIINRAHDEGRPWSDLAEEWEEAWWASMDLMGVARPHLTPHATAFVPEMLEFIGALVDDGVAYEISDGIYLSVRDVPGYGLLAQQSLESLRAGARIEVAAEKRSPMDFVLWKKAKPGEPSWDSPWGPGRPGWHTECVVMSLALLGDGFDLHGGGDDLKFPHHENERAQAVASGHEFARHWMHNGMVEVGGQKMSKSLDNFTDLTDLLSSTDPRAYRLLVMQAHYRAPMEVGPDRIADAERALGRLDALSRRLAEAGTVPEGSAGLTAGFRERMDDDLDTPRAMALVFDGIRAANGALDRGENEEGLRLGREALACAEAVGLRAAGGLVVDEHVVGLARQRDEARAQRDWSEADRLRGEIVRLGYRVEDTGGGTRVLR